MTTPNRYERFHDRKQTPDNRDQGARDRDRILYSTAFRRLGGVTQVASPSEGHVFHNRLTHVLEVAQISRRLAEKLQGTIDPDVLEDIGGLSPEVVEAAALAHDLGHPPFGHVGEQALHALAVNHGLPGGYEGNAQSLRIVDKLAVRYSDCPGLNLTRATLNALLKYPWTWEESGKKSEKWGVYHSEKPAYEWARRGVRGKERKTVEAELMDWADDIAYAVHDVEDFYRAGLIPLDHIAANPDEALVFLDRVFSRWRREGRRDKRHSQKDLSESFMNLIGHVPLPVEPYRGQREQRAALRSSTSFMIDRYVRAISLAPSRNPKKRLVSIDPKREMEVLILKQLTWEYVICNPALATQQHGMKKVITDLFEVFYEAATSDEADIFPYPYQQQLRLAESLNDADEGTARSRAKNVELQKVRVAIDLIASLTDDQALRLHKRLTGINPGSVLDSMIR